MASFRAGRPNFKCLSALRFFFVLRVVFSFCVAEFFFFREHEEEARLLAGRREDVAAEAAAEAAGRAAAACVCET